MLRPYSPGNDAGLKDEYVVFSAHLDHLGIGKLIAGDAIYNGAGQRGGRRHHARDRRRAQGLGDGLTPLRPVRGGHRRGEGLPRVALLRDSAHGRRPNDRRGYQRRHVPASLPFKMLTIYGMQESDLGEDAVAVAESLGVTPQADPEPKRNLFIRSDQYSFIRVGVPSLALKLGFSKASPEERMAKEWPTTRYHAPSDDLNQPVDKQAAADFDVLVAKLLERVANRDERPRWNDDSFFNASRSEVFLISQLRGVPAWAHAGGRSASRGRPVSPGDDRCPRPWISGGRSPGPTRSGR